MDFLVTKTVNIVTANLVAKYPFPVKKPKYLTSKGESQTRTLSLAILHNSMIRQNITNISSPKQSIQTVK